MKKLLCALLLLFVLTLPVFAAGDISIHPDSRWLVLEDDTGLQVLTDDYVLDFHLDPETGVVYYTALENGEALLRAVQPGEQPRTIPLEDILSCDYARGDHGEE